MTARRLAFALVLAALFASPVLAQDPGPGPHGESADEVTRPDPETARKLAAEAAREAQAAHEKGDFDAASKAWARAAELRPEEPAFRYNQGVAEERAGRRKPADEAYRAALSGARTEVEKRALFNIGSLALEDAMSALGVAEGAGDELARALAGQATDPDGQPLEGPRLEEAAQAIRQQAVNTGLQRIGDALDHLRELIRRDRKDADGLHNLELAQRARARLVAAQRELEQSGSSNQDKQKKEDDRRQSGEQGDNEQEGDPESSKDTSQNESKNEQDESGETSQEDKAEGGPDERQQQEGRARQLTEEQAKRLLEQMLEQAAKRAKDVKERRRNAARRTPVEKDW